MLVPWPGADRTVRLPPIFSMMVREIDRPSPVPMPTGLVVKNGSNMRASTSGAIPHVGPCGDGVQGEDPQRCA